MFDHETIANDFATAIADATVPEGGDRTERDAAFDAALWAVLGIPEIDEEDDARKVVYRLVDCISEAFRGLREFDADDFEVRDLCEAVNPAWQLLMWMLDIR